MCPQCKAIVSEENLYCASCGYSLGCPEVVVIPNLMSIVNQETVPVAAPSGTTPGQSFFPPASPPAPYTAAPAYSLAPPVVYPPDFPKTLVRRLTRTHTFRAGLVFLVLSFLFVLAQVLLIVTTKPSLFQRDFPDFTQSQNNLLMLISNSYFLLISLFLIVVLVRLSGSYKAADRPLVKSLSLLTSVPIVACVGFLFSYFAGILLVFFPYFRTMFLNEYSQNAELTYWSTVGIIVLLAAAIAILLYCFAFFGFRNIRNAVKTGIPSAKYVSFIAVMLFFLGLFSVWTFVTSLLPYFGQNPLYSDGFAPDSFRIICFILLLRPLFLVLSSLLMGITLSRYARCTKKGILP